MMTCEEYSCVAIDRRLRVGRNAARCTLLSVPASHLRPPTTLDHNIQSTLSEIGYLSLLSPVSPVSPVSPLRLAVNLTLHAPSPPFRTSLARLHTQWLL